VNDDLRYFKAPDSFQILDASDAALVFIVVFVIANVLAICGVL